MLSDIDIAFSLSTGGLGIDPYDSDNMQPASYDLTLDCNFLVPNDNVVQIDMYKVKPNHMIHMRADKIEGIVLQPGEFILGSTLETITIGDNFVGRIEGKSSIGRLGLLVHVTAGFIDPGFSGQVTLEMFNAAPWDLVLYPGQQIAQIAFQRLEKTPSKIYGQRDNKYQNSRGPVESRFTMKKSKTQIKEI